MKKSILTILLLCTTIFTPLTALNDNIREMCVDKINIVKDSEHEIDIFDITIDPQLIDAIISVESNNGKRVYGDLNLGEPSVGVLQIRPIMVDDVNRILRLQGYDKEFSYNDRYSKERSIEMFLIYTNYYAFDHLDNHEHIARIWNGGPDGYRQYATLHYWNKVNKRIPKKSL
jgi:hypothetical protein